MELFKPYPVFRGKLVVLSRLWVRNPLGDPVATEVSADSFVRTGFRLPASLLDFAIESKWSRTALYQVIFPISMLIALSVKPPKWSSALPARMPICRESQWATEWVLQQLLPKSLVNG